MSNDVLNMENSMDAGIENTGMLKELLNEMFPDTSVSEDAVPELESPEVAEESAPEKVQADDHPDASAATEADVADAIAQAVAHTFALDDMVVPFAEEPKVIQEEIPAVSSEVEIAAEVPSETEASEAPAVSEAAEPSEESAPVETQPVEAVPAHHPSEKTQRRVKRNPDDKGTKKPEKKAAPEKAAKASKEKQTDPVNPGTGYVKISRSHVSVSPGEYFGNMFSGVIDRQKEALPPVGVDLKKHEKVLAVKTGFDRLVNPVRYVILLLMFLCLCGRKYQWMTLGFLSGVGGTFVSLVLTIVIMILCWQSVYRGVRDIGYLRFSYESYLLIATLLTMFEALSTRNENSLLPLLTMSWCFSGFATLMDGQANLRALRSVITDRNKVGVRSALKKWKKQDLIGKAASGTAGFVRCQAEPDVWHGINTWFLLPLMVVCVVASAYLSAKTESNYLTVLVTLLDIGMPLSMVLCCARPYNLLSQVLSGKAAIAGWAGIKALCGKKSVLIYDNDLFPSNTTGHKGVKVYGRYTASQLVSFGASLVIRADIGLTDVFVRLLRDGDGQLLEVSHIQIQESGVEGRILRNRVQVGTYQFMQLMGVSVPQKGSSNGVYIAINGNLAGMFAVKYALRAGSVSAFRRFTREKNLTSVIATRNFTITPAFIEKSFKAPIARLSCPKTEVRRSLSAPSVFRGSTTCGFLLQDGISAYSRMIGGARRIYRMGLWYTLLSVALTIYLTVSTISSIASGTEMIEVTRILLMHFWLYVAVEIGARISVRK